MVCSPCSSSHKLQLHVLLNEVEGKIEFMFGHVRSAQFFLHGFMKYEYVKRFKSCRFLLQNILKISVVFEIVTRSPVFNFVQTCENIAAWLTACEPIANLWLMRYFLPVCSAPLVTYFQRQICEIKTYNVNGFWWRDVISNEKPTTNFGKTEIVVFTTLFH